MNVISDCAHHVSFLAVWPKPRRVIETKFEAIKDPLRQVADAGKREVARHPNCKNLIAIITCKFYAMLISKSRKRPDS